MATCRSIVNRALRKIGVLAAGREARPSDAEDTLEALKGLYKAWISSGAFGRMADVVPNADFTAGENQRIFVTVDTVATITLPELVPMHLDPLPYDQERVAYTNYEATDGANRPPKDGAVVEVVEGDSILTYLYDGTLRRWQEIGAMALADDCPRSHSDPEGLAACLALEIAGNYDAGVSDTDLRQARRYEETLSLHLSRPREAAAGVYC